MFLATGLGQFAYQNYDTVWNLPTQDESVLSLMPSSVLGMIKFFELIKSQVGSKIFLSDLLEIGIDADTFLTLAMLVIVRQGTERLQYYVNNDQPFIVYSGQ